MLKLTENVIICNEINRLQTMLVGSEIEDKDLSALIYNHIDDLFKVLENNNEDLRITESKIDGVDYITDIFCGNDRIEIDCVTTRKFDIEHKQSKEYYKGLSDDIDLTGVYYKPNGYNKIL